MTDLGWLTELLEREPSALDGLDDPYEFRGRRCSARFALGHGMQVVEGVYLGTFEDSSPEEGGTGRETIRLLGDDGQLWETLTVEIFAPEER